jgi:NADH dehydrogenase
MNMSAGLLKITPSTRISILGGGPSGAFFSLYLSKYCREKAFSPDIRIYEQRDFRSAGIKGCKGCAGILSQTLLNSLDELNIKLPESIIQSTITNYTVHSPYTSISLDNTRAGTRIVSIYRGGGPRQGHQTSPASFNEWLAQEAQKAGAVIEEKSVSGIDVRNGIVIEADRTAIPCDLAVLATGIGSPPIKITGLKYVPPDSQVVAQGELYLGEEKVKNFLGNDAHVFLIPHSEIVFGTLVPKGPFVSVTVLSKGKTIVTLREFLNLSLVQAVLPESFDLSCFCQPRVALGLAKNYFSDGFVAIGDGVVSRLYKDGIGSALLTARSAAQTVMYSGCSADDFGAKYAPLCLKMHKDNLWGRALFSLNNVAKNSRLFLLAQNRIIGDEQNNIKGPQPFTNAAKGMFTGGYAYKTIAWMIFNPMSISRLWFVLVREGLRMPFRRPSSPRKLLVRTQKILILGSGFGGTYVLRKLLPSLNRNENIDTVMISDENFFLFTPLLHEVAMGKIETRHVAFPIRKLGWKDRFTFVQDKVLEIDVENRRVTTTRSSYEFNYLVLALGSVTDIPSFKSQSDILFTLKTLHDSMLVRNHIIEVFERAENERDLELRRSLLTFVVCGAGYTGIQVVTELRDFVYRSLLKFYRDIRPEEVKIVLVEAEPSLLSGLPTNLSSYVSKQLRSKGIELFLDSRITDVDSTSVEINGNKVMSIGTLLWVAGVKANPVVSSITSRKDAQGRIVVNEFLEATDWPGVYALGDCIHFEDKSSGATVPPRAHHAVRQAKIVAHNILAEIRGWDKRVYSFKNNTEIISLGSSDAVFK